MIEQIIKNPRSLFFGIAAFFLPLYPVVSVLALVAAALISLIAFFKTKYFRVNRFTILLAGFFGLHLLGLLYTTNFDYGFFDVQTKLSFIFLPLLFALCHRDPKIKPFVQVGFVCGCFVAASICLARAAVFYCRGNTIEHFFYEDYSYFMHVTYFTIYINVCILIIINYFYNKTKPFSRTQIVVAGIFSLFFFVNIFLLNGRTSTFVAYVTVFTLLTIVCIRKKSFPGSIFIAIGILIFVGIIHWRLIAVYNRYTQVTEFWNNRTQIEQQIKKHEYKDYNSTSARFEMWSTAVEIIKANPFFGVGTGDVKDELVKYYSKAGFSKGVSSKHNPHNTFLQTGIALGLAGMVLLILILVIPFIYAIRNKNYLFAGIILVIALNSLTESILERQAGIIFFSLFYCMLSYEIEKVPLRKEKSE